MSADLPPITLVWLESVRSGTASELHLNGTLQRLRSQGCVVREVISSDAGGRTTTLERIRRLGSLLLRALRARHDGLLFARFHPLLLPVLWWWRRGGATVVLSVQGALDPDVMDGVPVARAWARLNRHTLRQAHGVITVTAGLAETLRPLLRSDATPLAVIPNGINPPHHAATPPRATWPYAIFVGNLAAWQGIEQMLAATRHPSWPAGLRLVVVGDGSQADLVHAEGGEVVVPVGRLPRDQAMTWLAGAVFAFSLQDPKSGAASGGYWPYKILEAAASGVPTITSDAAGLQEMAEELGSVIVCPFGDAAAVASAAARLSSDRNLREQLGRAGKANVVPHFWKAKAPTLVETLVEARAERDKSVPAPKGCR